MWGMWREKLRALCEGLEIDDIDNLMLGKVEDVRKAGKEIAKRTKLLARRAAKIHAASKSPR